MKHTPQTQTRPRLIRAVWAFYAVTIAATGALYSGARPVWLFTTVAMLSLVAACALLARDAARP